MERLSGGLGILVDPVGLAILIVSWCKVIGWAMVACFTHSCGGFRFILLMTQQSAKVDLEAALAHLLQEGYVVLEGVLGSDELVNTRQEIQHVFDAERKKPPDPGDAQSFDDEEELGDYFARIYSISDAERKRLVRRARRTRQDNYNTPWPVPLEETNKGFFHFPTLFDHDRSQRIWNLPLKFTRSGRFIEDSTLLSLVRSVLGADCVLSDFSATSIGPRTNGGSWHVDVPLTQIPEPLPNFPITVQNAWMLDDFTPDNGATRIVPRSHLSQKKPKWGQGSMDGEVVLTAPAGSIAIWLSQTWHRSGPNNTDQPRRAILGYYCRSWVKPVTDLTRWMSPEKVTSFSPVVRYLLGWSAFGPDRG